MVTDTKTETQPKEVPEDPLAYLPCSAVLEFRRGQPVYNRNQPSTSLYLVISGKVKVGLVADNGDEVLMDIYQEDEFFGECALIGLPLRRDSAVALDSLKVMAWTADEIEKIAAMRPRLAIALLQLLAQRSTELGERIESCALDYISRRLARALIRFSERFGHPVEDGSVEMISFTHELLSQYVGAAREIITHHMNQFRSEGYVRYSRSDITVNLKAMKNWLEQKPVDGRVSRAKSPHPALLPAGMASLHAASA